MLLSNVKLLNHQKLSHISKLKINIYMININIYIHTYILNINIYYTYIYMFFISRVIFLTCKNQKDSY